MKVIHRLIHRLMKGTTERNGKKRNKIPRQNSAKRERNGTHTFRCVPSSLAMRSEMVLILD